MRSSLPVVLALGPGLAQVVMIAIAVGFPILNWIYRTAKGGSGTGGSLPRRGPGAGPGTTPQRLGQSREEEPRRLNQQQLDQARRQSGSPASNQEKTAAGTGTGALSTTGRGPSGPAFLAAGSEFAGGDATGQRGTRGYSKPTGEPPSRTDINFTAKPRSAAAHETDPCGKP